jgi:hypothetical protein
MASINGYQYITEQEAQNAVTLCNQHYGIPKSPTDITQNWCEYFYAELNNPVFWYITFDDTLLPVLGQHTIFDVVIQTEPTLDGYVGS